MVVVLIISILLAVAIPTFRQAQSKAEDRSAQSIIRTSYLTSKFHYMDARAYTQDHLALMAQEPSLTLVASLTPAATVGTVFVNIFPTTPSATSVLYLSSKSASGKCLYLRQNPTLGTVDYASQTATPCLAANHATINALYTTRW